MGGSYQEALRLLEERSETRWDLGLGRIRGILSRLEDPQGAVPAVHVAGTNGKGTFCALLSAALSEAGFKTGLYTSPHLIEPTERIRVNGVPVSGDDFGRLLSSVRDREAEFATYFELATAAAFLHFKEVGAKIAVIETGLGGRLDATNVVKRPLLTVITSIGLDHTEHLGDTLAKIAVEKAGILKPGVPCLVGDLSPEALAVVRARAKELGAPLIEGVPELKAGFPLKLLGKAAAKNAALVLAALEHLRGKGFDVPGAAAKRAFARAEWPCRFQVLNLDGRTLVLDGAHNPDAVAAFLDTWKASPWSKGRCVFVLGLLQDKDWKGMLDMLAPVAREVIAVRPDSPRALDPGEIAARLGPQGCKVATAGSIEEALRAWRLSGAPAGAVCGSFYLAGRALRVLQAVAA